MAATRFQYHSPGQGRSPIFSGRDALLCGSGTTAGEVTCLRRDLKEATGGFDAEVREVQRLKETSDHGDFMPHPQPPKHRTKLGEHALPVSFMSPSTDSGPYANLRVQRKPTGFGQEPTGRRFQTRSRRCKRRLSSRHSTRGPSCPDRQNRCLAQWVLLLSAVLGDV